MNFAHTPDAVYLTPTGRRCRWLPHAPDSKKWASNASFAYLDAASKAMADGFCLTEANYRILRPEAVRAPRR